MTSPSGRIFHLEANGTLSPLGESPFSLGNQLQRQGTNESEAKRRVFGFTRSEGFSTPVLGCCA